MKDQAHDLRQRMLEQEQNQAHTIAIFSGKGGVGKSNFALNFGMALSDMNKKVLIFDLDIGMGNIDILLGLQPKQSLSTMLEKKLQISDIIETGPQQLSYVAAGTGLSDFFHLDRSKYDYFVRQLQYVTASYDYIIFDLGAGMTEEHLAFIQAADESIVVTTTEPTSITDAYAAMKRLVVHSDRDDLQLSLLVNRASDGDEGEFAYSKLNAVVTKFLECDLTYQGYMPDDPSIMQAVKQQEPFYTFVPRSKATKQIKKLVESFLNQESDSEPDRKFIKRIRSFFSRKVD
ncbi:flagellar biosynthesis protein FlhG [Alkalibacillus flavidus]|uniref:Flagellar biosynthesis protein FlhG n=1 Tax=Alkalibacillus flavidus TaxID=546021 RepID=A0ABV2KRD7_9BACI